MRRTLIYPRIGGLRDSNNEERTETNGTGKMLVEMKTLVVETVPTVRKLGYSIRRKTHLSVFPVRSPRVRRRLLERLSTQITISIMCFRRLWR